MQKGRPAGRQGRPMKQKAIGFRELLERLLPLDELPPASRLEVHRALRAGVGSQLERAALEAMSQLEQKGALKRLPSADNGVPQLRYQTRDALDVITIHVPAAAKAEGLQVFPRAMLPTEAEASLVPVRRLMRLDDTLVADPGQARNAMLEQLSLAGREILGATEVRFYPVDPTEESVPPLDGDLAEDAIESPNAIHYVPDATTVPRLAAAARARQMRAAAVSAVVSSEGQLLGHLEVLSADADPFRPADLALVALLADSVAGLLERAARIEKLVFVDPLTTAYNRSYFDQQVHIEMARAQRERSSMALCLADIDDFKGFNTSYGYEAGNQVLVQVVHALKRAVRPFDIVVRWGGEEFAVLLTAPVTAEDARTVSERLRSLVERQIVRLESLDRQNHRVGVSVSIGVALFPDHAEDAQSLWRAANQALLVAKRPPKNRVVFHEASSA